MEDYMSGYLEDFINFIDSVEEQDSISKTELIEANIDLQDLEHYIEFGKADARQRLKIYNLYQMTRNKRRKAKENVELCSPIVEWCGKNRKVIQDLRALLGQIRKIESQQANRAYAIRGHILDSITTLSHLTERSENNG